MKYTLWLTVIGLFGNTSKLENLSTADNTRGYGIFLRRSSFFFREISCTCVKHKVASRFIGKIKSVFH